jgi:hypothetical protein
MFLYYMLVPFISFLVGIGTNNGAVNEATAPSSFWLIMKRVDNNN